jgi:pimeloyl-ACP methyl ester carboxylesterase
MEPQIRYVRTSDDVRVATYRLGGGSPGVPVVIASPYTLTTFSSEWRLPDIREGYERLAERRPVITYDPRGYGFSDRDVTELGLDARVRDLAAVVDSASSSPVNIVGRAQAAMVAVAFAAEHPRRVARMILSAGTARARDLGSLGAGGHWAR